MNCQTVEMFTRAYQSVCEGRSVDKTVLKPLLDLTKDVYGKGFSKNMESADDRYHAGFYLKDLPESLPNGDCRNKAKCLYELFIYNHYSIDPSKVVSFVDDYFDELKYNVYIYLLIINLISNTTEWQLPDYMIYQFNQLFNQIEGL
jgi:hypothetical protein